MNYVDFTLIHVDFLTLIVKKMAAKPIFGITMPSLSAQYERTISMYLYNCIYLIPKSWTYDKNVSIFSETPSAVASSASIARRDCRSGRRRCVT